MMSLGSDFILGLQALMQPVELLAMLAGTLAGLWLGPAARRIGIESAAVLLLVLPLAAMLDPIAGLMLLAAAFTAMIEKDIETDWEPEGRVADGRAPWRRAEAMALAAVIGAAAIIAGASPWLAERLQALAPADSNALLIAGAMVAAAVAAQAGGMMALTAILQVLAGLALYLGPWSPFDSEQHVPFPVLLGAVVAGPALMALAFSRRESDRQTAHGAIESIVTFLPAFLVGVPITLSAAVKALNLSDNGLQIGPKLMVDRPKLVLGTLAAAIAALVIGAAGRWLGNVTKLSGWVAGRPNNFRVRVAALLILALALVAFYRSGIDRDGILTGLDGHTLALAGIATVAGAAAARMRLTLVPFAIGLITGQLLQPIQPPEGGETVVGDGSTAAALFNGSHAMQAIVVVAFGLALASAYFARRSSR